MDKNMTALVSLFARVYHTRNSNIKIYNDIYGDTLLGDDYTNIYNSVRDGIKYFDKDYNGDNPVEYIVNNYLAPSVLARLIFNEDMFLNEIRLGCRQYLILASGYDTSGYKVNNGIKVFELDKEGVIKDKIERIKRSGIDNGNVNYIGVDFNKDWIYKLFDYGFDMNIKTHVSLLGISYYLDRDVFKNTIKEISDIIPVGSSILFDYPNVDVTDKEIVNRDLAREAKCDMRSVYSRDDIIDICNISNTDIYVYMNYDDINNRYFYNYNTINVNNRIMAPRGVSYVMLVKR